MLRRFGTFTGGIELPDDKEATLNTPVLPPPRLARVRVPLALVEAAPARPTLPIGEYVSRGQRLATAEDDRQVDVYAPLAGRVIGLTQVMLPARGGWRISPAVELGELDAPTAVVRGPRTRRSAFGDAPLPLQYDSQAADAHSIRLRLKEGGVMTFRPPVTPVAAWVERARQGRVDILIGNMMENVPFVSADHRLLAEQGSDVVRGLAILARAIGCREVVLAVDQRRTDDYREAVGPARLHGIESISLAHKYPTGADAMLTRILARREIPPGGAPLDVGVAVTDAATCWAVYRWVGCGQPPTARVVTVSGPHVTSPGNYLAPFGMDAFELLRAAGARDDEIGVHGPAMTGRQLVLGAVVSSTTNALLALMEPEAARPTPCIRCGWCTSQCPARLNVAGLNDDFELGRAGRARHRGALACIGCGVCSYICPARLPLAERLGLLKQAIARRKLVRPD